MSVEEVKELVRKIAEKYSFKVVESKRVFFGVDIDRKVIKYNPEMLVKEIRRIAGKSVSAEEYIDYLVEHEVEHIKNKQFLEKNCPDVLENIVLKMHSFVRSVVEDSVVDKRLERVKSKVVKADREIAREDVEKYVQMGPLASFYLALSLAEAIVHKDLSKLRFLLLILQNLTEEDLDKLKIRRTVLGDLYRDLQEVLRAAEKNLCEAYRKMDEICKKYELPCYVIE